MANQLAENPQVDLKLNIVFLSNIRYVLTHIIYINIKFILFFTFKRNNDKNKNT